MPALPSMQPSEKSKCDKELLLDILAVNLDRNWPEAREAMLEHPEVERGKVNQQEESLYHDLKMGPLMDLGSCCDPLVNMDGLYIGIDKLDHMLGHGYEYYQKWRKKKNIHEALAIGIRQEHGVWGLSGSGVKSYADLAANYAGLIFWSNLFDGKSPLFICAKGTYHIGRTVDFRKYVSPALDEGINCSSYKSKKLAQEIDQRFRSMGDQKRCPIKLSLCKELRSYYPREIWAAVLHPRCLHEDRDKPLYELKSFGSWNTLKDYWHALQK